MKEGKCSSKPPSERVTHNYLISYGGAWPADFYSYEDLFGYSCLNGWGFGNIAVTAMDISKFFY